MFTLVINLGLKSTRAIVYDKNGIELANNSLSLESFIDDERVEQNAEEWWEKTKKVLELTLKDSSIRKKISYITVTCSSSCLIAVDKNNNPLCPVIMVSDKRAKMEAEKIKKTKWYRKKIKKNNILVDASFMLPKILWIKNNEPSIFKKTHRFLSPNDFLVAKLSGCYVTDILNAEKMYYNADIKKYEEDLLAELKIPKEKLPDVVSPGTNIGRLSERRVNEFKLNNPDVIVSTYDAICAIFGSGVNGNGDVCDISGTITSVRTISHKSKIKINPKIFTQSYNHEGIIIIGGTSNQGGSIIEWLKQSFYSKENSPYKEIELQANKSMTASRGLLFLPYILGERVPLWNPNATGVFFGIQRHHTLSDFTKAVLESTGYLTRGILEEIERTGTTVRVIKMSGGLSVMHSVAQVKADITGKKVLVAKNYEASALGALIIALHGAGVFPSLEKASKKLIRFDAPIYPNKKNKKIYDRYFKLYKELYNTLIDVFNTRKKILDQGLEKEKLSEIANL